MTKHEALAGCLGHGCKGNGEFFLCLDQAARVFSGAVRFINFPVRIIENGNNQ